MRLATLLFRSAAMVSFATVSIGSHASPAQAQTTDSLVQLSYTTDPVEPVAGDVFAGRDMWQVSQASRKSPGLAFLLSFLIVGAGQGYNGQWGKGAGMFIGELASFGVLVAGASDCFIVSGCGVSVAGFVGMVGFALWSWIDAPISASKINREIDAGGMALGVGPRLYDAPSAGAANHARLAGLQMVKPVPRVNLSLVNLQF